jgi:hypothetical protein
MEKEHISGSLVTISLVSWGVLLWHHFPQSFLFIPAVIGLVLAVFIEVYY